MTSDRSYRRALPHEVSIAEIERCAGTQFDPDIVDAFLAALDAGEITRGTTAVAA
jgi:HD-GYP domain-containing protein (c-di-GMP phosphodiesterase class II)